MSWEDQGRQYHMWFGHGKAPEEDSKSPGRAGRASGESTSGIASGLAYGAIAALPASQRGKAEAQYHNGTLASLTDALPIWIRNAQLDTATFADRFFGRSADDPAVTSLHSAVVAASLAPGDSEMRGAAEKIADAIKTVGLSQWPRFVAEAQARAQKVAAAGLEDDVTPVPVTDDHGDPVLSAKGEPMMRPAGMDPHFFVAQGLKDRRTEEALLATGNAGEGLAALAYELGALSHFRRGGPWDAQRVGGSYHPEFVDYATVAIGLYAAANGISRDEILKIQNHVAKDSHYSAKTEYDETYTHLPITNVGNTDIGYHLYESGRISTRSPER